jgi:uncharacterized membrane protein
MKQKTARRLIPAIALVACLFAGIVIGLYRNNITAGTLIGLGMGLIVMAILRYIMFSKKDQSALHDTEKTSSPND